ncbi:AB hydrolase-1 domain-containing protein [Heracleum sosnowskyi]|uniref:AB hydrolase-1 domain-containing protein n=1 Tax=Heracleum sosnowskyi TaxID=360622 RepID=A0AAD8HVE3_9APIA|nr:AB hydrolase-1 domain-containing protein [Heracleum sosnowskyi]
MDTRGGEYVSDHQLGIDKYHEYIVEQLNRYMQQHSYRDMYDQGIDTIRPPERSGYNTPARQSSTSIINKLQPPVKTPVVVHPDLHRPLVPSPPQLTSPVVGQHSRPSFVEDLVIGFKEISVDLRKFVKDVVKQNYDVVSKLRQVVLLVVFLGLAALYVNRESDATSPLMTKPFIHPPNSTHVLLPDGRHLAYQDQGVSAEKARFSIIAPHAFFSSRLAGIPGIQSSLMQEFGVRLITYDLPGFGKSDPHPYRNLKSSADDMLQLSYNMGVTDKFWVLGYSSGGMHAWAALKYIPDRLAGVFMVSPMISPYEPGMTKEERHRTWNNWSLRRKFMYFLGRRFPRFLSYFYRKSSLSANVTQTDKWLSLSLGKRDKAFIVGEMFQEFWKRDVEESVRQGTAKPIVEEAVLQVSNWGFSLVDLNIQKNDQGKGILHWLKSKYSQAEEEVTGFLVPIHIWQGMDDKVVPPSMVDFVERVLPGANVHKLFHHGHFTFFYFCHECHRQMFSTVFGDPKGPLATKVD